MWYLHPMLSLHYVMLQSSSQNVDSFCAKCANAHVTHISQYRYFTLPNKQLKTNKYYAWDIASPPLSPSLNAGCTSESLRLSTIISGGPCSTFFPAATLELSPTGETGAVASYRRCIACSRDICCCCAVLCCWIGSCPFPFPVAVGG